MSDSNEYQVCYLCHRSARLTKIFFDKDPRKHKNAVKVNVCNMCQKPKWNWRLRP